MGTAYLVTGIAGSGKSTIKSELTDRGYTAYDVDDGMAHWIHRTTGTPVAYDSALVPMTAEHDWRINKPALDRALASDDIVFICGSAHDLYQYYDTFDAVFLLQYPSADSVKARLASRTNNSYGKDPKELASILGYWKDYEQEYVKRDAEIIDCTTPLNIVVRHIINMTS